MSVQITLVQIDNYGPWTVTPEPRPEPDLQSLQARLYADLSQAVGAADGYTFYMRFDNMVAVTNGMDATDHARIQESLGNRYPVSVSMGVSVAETPAAALADATDHLQDAGSAQDADRREVLRGEYLDSGTGEDLQVAHFDVVDATGTYTDRMDAYESYVQIQRSYSELVEYMYRTHDSLSFFVGGDNVISVCPTLPDSALQDAIAHVRDAVGVDLQVGVGRGETPHAAGMDAKHALEECRHRGTRVERASTPLPGD